jgi:hypothetical protein
MSRVHTLTLLFDTPSRSAMTPSARPSSRRSRRADSRSTGFTNVCSQPHRTRGTTLTSAPPPWCSGEHGALSRRKREFDSPWGYRTYGPPGTRTQNHGINLPHRLSPASGAEAPALRSGPSLHPRPDRSGGRRMASEGSPADAGLPADRPIPGGFHRDGYSGALRGSQQIAADEPAISRLALLFVEVPCSAN